MAGIYGFCHLFLDELPEFGTCNLETPRQPLENRVVTISRASGSLTSPANFQCVAAMNPCPRGFNGDERKGCTCLLSDVQRYQQRISDPMMGRLASCRAKPGGYAARWRQGAGQAPFVSREVLSEVLHDLSGDVV